MDWGIIICDYALFVETALSYFYTSSFDSERCFLYSL